MVYSKLLCPNITIDHNIPNIVQPNAVCPHRIATENGWYIDRPALSEEKLTEAPKEITSTGNIFSTTAMQEEITSPKKAQWERKLLDLGLRNALINMRLSKTTVPVLTPSLDELENVLSDGRDFYIKPRPENYMTSPGNITFENIHELGNIKELIKSDFKENRLHSTLSETELPKAVKELYRASKTALEENGANTLYLEGTRLLPPFLNTTPIFFPGVL